MKIIFTRFIFFSAIVLLSIFEIEGQNSINTSIGVRPQYGFIIAHRPSVLYLAQQHVPAIEIFYQQKSKRENINQAYLFPNVGYSLLYLDFRNKKYLGKAISLDRFIDLDLSKNKNKISVRLGAGIAYLTKAFDRIETNKNLAISTKLNIHLAVGLQYVKQLKNFTMSGGIIYNHYSNGSFKIPNLGINVPALQLGIAYAIKKDNLPDRVEKIIFNKSSNVTINASFGAKESYRVYGKKFFVGSVYGMYQKNISLKSFLIGGVDLIYNSSLNARVKSEFIEPITNKFAIVQLGLNIGYGLKFNKLELLFQSGVYAISNYKLDGFIYSRLSSRYFISNKLFLLFALKSHFAKADYGEIGLGFKMNCKGK